MKRTIITSAIVIGYFILMSMFGIIASVPGNVQRMAKENLRTEIAQKISCPSFITENSALNDVKALVKINDQGKVEVMEINAATQQLKNYVAGELQKMKFKNAVATESFVLVIRFRVV